MENYTKYKLKSNDELASVLDGKDNLFVIACNKCFKEFETVDEPDCDEFLKFAADQGKNVTGSAKFDFLCNKMHTERKLQDLIPEGTENVVVISCGLGIQTVADLAGKPVVAASNTLNYRGHHGMALTKKSCDACAQCYLNITGGVCPIVDCSKSLVNGQCGGAKNGKCEVDPNKDCAWEKIYQRLAKQGRLEEFLNQPVQVRDFSKVNFKVINDYVKSIREDRLDGYYGGVHPSERKEFSEHIALKKFPDPKTVVISMSQHLGAPANPIVQVGDTVKVGQKIGEAAGFISAPVHSSVSGTVVAVEPRMHGTRGSEVMAVVIESDGKNTLHESVQPHGDLDNLTPDEIIDIIRAIRNQRTEMNIPPSKKAKVYIETAEAQIFVNGIPFLQRLASASEVEVGEKFELPGAVQIITHAARALIPMDELIDREKELARLEKEREKCQSDIDFIGRKLDNPGFVAKAPAQLIETERAKLAQHKERMAKILESIAAMRK